MKHTSMITMAVVGAFAASTASAQVAASFDGLVDDVLRGTNAAVFSGAVNTAKVDGSVFINGGSDLAPGSVAADQASNSAGNVAANIDLTAFESVASSSVNEGSGVPASQVTNAFASTSRLDLTGAVAAAASTAQSSAFNLTVEPVTQRYGEVSSVAAGAINDGITKVTEEGAVASVDIASNTSNTAFSGLADNVTGDNLGIVETAFNRGTIDGSIGMAVTNANVVATSVGSTAAGAINTSRITATFVGGSGAESNVTPPQ